MKAKKRKLFYSLLGLILFACTFALLEIASRVYLQIDADNIRERIEQHQAVLQRSLSGKPQFESHAYLAYTPSDVVLSASGVTIAEESFTFHKPDHTLRIACLGGSTTKNAYPRWLREAMRHSFPNRKIEVMDWGSQGWTMAESTINYVIRVQDFSPDVVILHHGINDLAPRVRKDFAADYSHYRKPMSYEGLSVIDRVAAFSVFTSWMQLSLGIRPGDLNTWTVRPNPGPVQEYPGEDTVMLYRNGIKTVAAMAKKKGSKFIAAGMAFQPGKNMNERNIQMVEEHNRIMEKISTKHNAMYIDMQSVLRHYPDWFIDRCHLRNHGNKLKANWLANAIAHEFNQPLLLNVTKQLPQNPSMKIQWNLPPDSYEEVAVYVQEEKAKPEWMYTASFGSNELVWKQNDERMNGKWKAGPQIGTRYKFLIWKIKDGKQVPGGIVQVGEIQW